MDHRSESPRSRRKACSRCITAKAKCILADGLEGCERCRRLHKDCSFDAIDQRQRGKDSMRIQKLEEQVKGLVDTVNSLTNATSATETPVTIFMDENHDSDLANARAQLSGSISTSMSAHYLPELDIVGRGLVTIAQADNILEKFRTIKTPYFPFVVIPQDTDASTLHLQFPFLFLAIMTVGFEDDFQLQKLLGAEIKQIISKRVIINNEKKLELIQGLLVCICWYHYQFDPETQQIWLLLQLASALTITMDLNRNPTEVGFRIGSTNGTRDMAAEGNGQSDNLTSIAAENRAFLGCYYLSSVLSLFRKQVPIKHNRWIEECCQTLTNEKQFTTDRLLVVFVQSQHLARRVCDTFSFDGTNHFDTQNEALLEMSMKVFRQELSQLEACVVSFGMQENRYLVLEHKSLSVLIHEVALHHHSTAGINFSRLHIQHLWTLLSSSRDLVSYFIETPASVIKQLPMPLFHMLWYGFVVLSKVVLLPSTNGWDAILARSESRILELAVKVRTKISSLSATELRESDKDFWCYLQDTTKSMLSWLQGLELTREPQEFNTRQAIIELGGGTAPRADNFYTLSGTLAEPGTSASNDYQNQNANRTQQLNVIQSDGLDEMQVDDWNPEIWQNMLDEFCLIPPSPVRENITASSGQLFWTD